MHTISVQSKAGSYPVYLGHGNLEDKAVWRQHLGDGKVLIVSNDVFAQLYLKQLKSALPSQEVETHIISDGEQNKHESTWSGIIDKLVSMQARRDATLIALGGGVVGDITGFAAASYMRGVRFLQVPTTLLAQVDASVGGKTGFNHPDGKNLVGAFHQPAAVVIDTDTLHTLQPREFNAGMAEVVKYGVIMDQPFFDWLEAGSAGIQARDEAALAHLIQKSVQNKAQVVSEDEREAGIRAILNFGHSFGHALETVTHYQQFLHGEAVAIGMVIAARLSELRNLCPTGCADRIRALLQEFSLPVDLPREITTEALVRALELDKKAIASGVRLILLNDLGKVEIDSGSSRAEIESALELCRAPNPSIQES
jgi:3-dehydroquinate synthase